MTDESPPRARRRTVAPPAHPFFRFLFPALLVGAAVAVFVLWQEGAKAVYDSSDGTDVEIITDPAAPGYIAFAEPTPTQLVAHVDADGGLVGVTLLARTLQDSGGSMVIFSRDMIIEPPGREPVVLGSLFAEQGIDGLAQEIGAFMGFGFTDPPLVLDPEGLADWMRLAEPIPYRLPDDLVAVDGDGDVEVVIEAASRDFDAVTLAEVYGWRNPAEVDAARIGRQEDIWRAWLTAIGSSEVAVESLAPFDEFGAYLRSFGTGSVKISTPPVVAVAFEEGERPTYTLAEEDLDWARDTALEMVPFPVGFEPGARPTVQLLDGTGDPEMLREMRPVVVAAGGEVSVIGNAASFDVPETTVTYHDAADEDAATRLAEELGVGVVFVEDPNQPADLTVTIGG